MKTQLAIPLTRRNALAAGGGLLVSAALPAFSTADEAAKPEFTFALVSDNHLGRRGETDAKNMKAAAMEINNSAAAFVVFCGDLVNQGELAENEHRYEQWLQIAAELKRPYYAIAGNHDPTAMFTKHIREDTDFAFDFGKLRFICFNDALPNPEHQGAVTLEQLAWMQATIDEAARQERQVILVSHVIYHRNRHPDVGWRIKTREQEFGELLEANSRRITAFFAGHFHCGLRGWSDTFGIHEVVLPSTSWNRNRGLDEAPGYALDEFRAGYTMADVYRDRLVLTYKPLGEEAQAVKELPRKV